MVLTHTTERNKPHTRHNAVSAYASHIEQQWDRPVLVSITGLKRGTGEVLRYAYTKTIKGITNSRHIIVLPMIDRSGIRHVYLSEGLCV